MNRRTIMIIAAVLGGCGNSQSDLPALLGDTDPPEASAKVTTPTQDAAMGLPETSVTAEPPEAAADPPEASTGTQDAGSTQEPPEAATMEATVADATSDPTWDASTDTGTTLVDAGMETSTDAATVCSYSASAGDGTEGSNVVCVTYGSDTGCVTCYWGSGNQNVCQPTLQPSGTPVIIDYGPPVHLDIIGGGSTVTQVICQ